MRTAKAASAARFIGWVTAAHVITYLLVGTVAAILLDYERLFEEPVIRDYMVAFGSTSLFLGPLLQLVRGVVIAIVMLPFRSALASARNGWLHLWLLLIGVGIVSTSAAAPSSLEGVVYTRLPLWYHAIGLPEMLIQTLIFSSLVHAHLRHPGGLLNSAPPAVVAAAKAVAAASFAFVGYALVSVAFAMLAGAPVTSEGNLTLRTQGLFLAPFLINIMFVLIAPRTTSQPPTRRQVILAGVVAYALNVVSLAVYQHWVLGGANLPYVVCAPIIPATVVALIATRSPGQATGRGLDHSRQDPHDGTRQLRAH
jgi:hypothetical protein